MAQPNMKKRKVLTLEDRMKVLDHSKKGLTAKAISALMGCGKTQVQSIVRDRESINALWQSGQGRADQKVVKRRKVCYEKLDDIVWEWFCTARSKNLPGKNLFSPMHLFMPFNDLGFYILHWESVWRLCRNLFS